MIEQAGKRVVHADEVAQAIFVIRTTKDLHYAKRTLNSELGRGAKRGLWQALGGNQFRAITRTGEVVS